MFTRDSRGKFRRVEDLQNGGLGGVPRTSNPDMENTLNGSREGVPQTKNDKNYGNVPMLDIWKPNFPIDDSKRMNFSMVLLGKRRSGKSNMVKYLYETYMIGKYNLVLIYTTPVNAEFYKKFILGKKVIDTNGDLNKLKKIIQKNSERKKKKRPPINVLCIFDDTNSRKEKFDNDIMDLYNLGRHFNISIVYNAQAATLTDTIWRENADLIFIWKQKTRRFQEYVADNLLSGFLDKDFDSRSKERNFYITLLKKNTKERYWALVVDNIEDNLFRFKATF